MATKDTVMEEAVSTHASINAKAEQGPWQTTEWLVNYTQVPKHVISATVDWSKQVALLPNSKGVSVILLKRRTHYFLKQP